MAPSADPDGDVTAGVTSMEEYGECDALPSAVVLSPTDLDELSAELETIVVGAVSMGAPWFMTGWAEGTEVEFMIDTGCQVTILATSLFERMCVADPRFRRRLRPYGRRLVLADSSPLMVRGELCMSVAFPGLQCDMTLVIANIGSEGLLGMEALQSGLPHQLDLRMGQLWDNGQSTLQLHQQRQAVRASAYTKGSVVIPLDSEIVVPASIRSPAGILPGRCSYYGRLWRVGRPYFGRHI